MKLPSIEKWIKKNWYYHHDLGTFFSHHINPNSNILEIGSKTGFLLNSLKPKYGYGFEASHRLYSFAKKKYPNLKFYLTNYNSLPKVDLKFDYIIISDSLSRVNDIQQLFHQLHQYCSNSTRIIINYHSFLWLPLLDLLEKLHLKNPQKRTNWLTTADISNLLSLENFDLIKSGSRFLLPVYLPVISHIFNRYLANLPVLNLFCLTNYLIARPLCNTLPSASVSIIIAARNEKGNIKKAIETIPNLSKKQEIIFIEGGSNDGTFEEIKKLAQKYPKKNIRYDHQTGHGKGDAVRKGFSMAKNDILIILDADLTVAPEELPKFYQAITINKGEYINGSRLVYPMENEAMRFLNIIGNKFFSVMFSWILGQPIKDTLCGTKVISRINYLKLADNRHYFGDFDPFGDFDLIFGSSKLDLKFVEIPIRYKARTYGQTNISRFKHGWLLLKMTFFALNKIKFR